jgi:hypothetical protein
VVLLLLSGVGETASPRAAQSLVLAYKGNRLTVKPAAPVPYSDPARMLVALQQASLPAQYAMVLVRDSPRQLVGYVLAVEREGTLSLGSQLHEWDTGDRRYRLLRGELSRSYPPLEGNSPWTWLVTIPIGRELEASLMIRAVERRWPVESVSVSMTRPRAR